MDSRKSRQRSTDAPSRIRSCALVAGLAATAALPSFAADRSGAEVVKAQCARCHEAGTANAPKPGDKSAWAPRLSR